MKSGMREKRFMNLFARKLFPSFAVVKKSVKDMKFFRRGLFLRDMTARTKEKHQYLPLNQTQIPCRHLLKTRKGMYSAHSLFQLFLR